MFKYTDIPVLGMIQNMSIFTCPHCNKDNKIELECVKLELYFIYIHTYIYIYTTIKTNKQN